MEYAQIFDNVLTSLRKKTLEEVGRVLQTLEREKFEYEEAKLLVEKYEQNDYHSDIWIRACEKILNENRSTV